jgi:hypothetical protein
MIGLVLSAFIGVHRRPNCLSEQALLEQCSDLVDGGGESKP